MQIIANWKNNLSIEESESLFSKYLELQFNDQTQIMIAPSNIALPCLVKNETRNLIPCAQSVSSMQQRGNYTGEILAIDLYDIGIHYSMVGHSERRVIFKETHHSLNQQVHSLLGAKMTPIFLVGETIEEREAGITEQVIIEQLDNGLAGVSIQDMDKLIIGYEPIWAITTFGGTKSCENQDIQTIFELINKWLMEKYGIQKNILYGGSVNPDNIARLVQVPNIGGFVIGNASLDIEKMKTILTNVY